MATKSVLTIGQVCPPSFAPRTRSTRDSPVKSNLMEQDAHPSNGQREVGKQGIKSVAVVDDEVELCSLFSMIVNRLGYYAECVAYDGDEIVKLVLEDSINPDLILMDYRMPTMNGLQAAERILRFRPEQKIIIATADDTVRHDVISAGLYFLQKPFSISALKRAIEEALEH